jgi:hypothetical protein
MVSLSGQFRTKPLTRKRAAVSNLNVHQGVKKRPRPFLTEAFSCRTGTSLTTSEVSRLHHYGFQILNAGPSTGSPDRIQKTAPPHTTPGPHVGS